MIKKIDAKQLKIGMYIHDLSCDWMSHPFLISQFKLKSEAEIEKIINAGIHDVYIDTSKGLDAANAPTEDEVKRDLHAEMLQLAGEKPAPQIRLTVAEEMERARQIKSQAHQLVRNVMQDARLGKAVELEQVEPVVESITESILRNSGALIGLMRIKNKDDYTFMHCVAVGTFMIALGKQLGMSDDELVDAGTAGLLHDVGKCLVPLDVLNKPGRLTAAEFDVIREHPMRGYRMLRDAGFQDSVALEVVLHHHERLDGKGYPDQLKGDEVTRLARMGAVVDVYDAMGSDRCYRKADPPTSVLKLLLSESGSHFDPVIVHSFIKSLGIYPNGSLVRLHSGRLAVVMEQHPEQALMPKVRVFYSTKSKMPVPTLDLDLSVERGDPIVGYEDPYEWGFDLTKVSGITF